MMPAARFMRFERLLSEPLRNGLYKNKEFHGTGTRIVNMGELFGNDFISNQEMKRLRLSDNEKARFLIRDGDLLFARRSVVLEGSGRCALVVAPTEETTFESSIIRARPDPRIVDPRFLFYSFRAPYLRAAVAGISSQTAVSGIRGTDLALLEVLVPALDTQHRIAGILSAYDDLIENCERRIRILDEMARALYREWFVLFRYPRHEKVPIVESSLGPLPKNWAVSALKEQTSKIGSGATPRGGKESYRTDGVALIRSLNVYDYRFEFSELAFIDESQAAQLDNVEVQLGDVLLNITGASVARCAMVPSYVLPARVNQHVAIVRARGETMNPYYLLDTINCEHNKRKLLGLAQGGATREALTKETISNFPIVLPPRDLVEWYGRHAAPVHQQRELLRREIEVLRKTRDLLLPRLLSGQLSIEDVA